MELKATTEPILSPPQLTNLSSSILAFLRSLLISIITHAALYLLLGAQYPSELERRTDGPTPPPSIWDSGSGLSEKVRKACDIARRDGYEYIWIDSCCIDKTSSSELSEAINSMFNWYRGAEVCYAYLSVRKNPLRCLVIYEDNKS